MKKRKSTHETTNMIQTAVWLPRDMHEKLKTGGVKLSDEIRRRLQSSFDAERLRRDPLSDELLDGIKHIEGNIDDPWHENRFAFDVFKAAINELLSDYQPSDAKPGTVTKTQSKYGLDVKAETIAKILANIAIKASIAKRPAIDMQRGS